MTQSCDNQRLVGTGSARTLPEPSRRTGVVCHWRTGTGVVRLRRVYGRSVTRKLQRIDKLAPALSSAPPTHTARGSCVSKLVLRRHACTRTRCTIAISRDVTAAWDGLAPGHRVITIRCWMWADLALTNWSPDHEAGDQRPEQKGTGRWVSWEHRGSIWDHAWGSRYEGTEQPFRETGIWFNKALCEKARIILETNLANHILFSENISGD